MIDRAPHYLLDRHAGWRAASFDNATTASGNVVLQPLPGATVPLADAAGTLGGLGNPAGIAVDSQNRIYVLDSEGCVIRRFDRCNGDFEILQSIGPCGAEPRRLLHPQGIAISCADDLYVADTGNRRVQVFALNGLALRRIIGPLQVVRDAKGIRVRNSAPVTRAGDDCAAKVDFAEGTWLPHDVVTIGNRWTYVSDSANGLIHVFDPSGCWHTAYDGKGPGTPALVKPTRLAVDQAGRIYVVQEGQSHVVILDADGKFAGTANQPRELAGRFCPISIAIDLDGNLCLGECFTESVYFYRSNGIGGWCTYRCCGAAHADAPALLFDRANKQLLLAGKQGVCRMLPESAFPHSGIYWSEPLDSKTYQCVWDRVQLSGAVPLGTGVRVDTFTSEGIKTFDEIAQLPRERWATGQTHSSSEAEEWDCLVQSPPGRYLWLRLTLTGDGSATPCIDRVKLYYPRSSSLKYLPAVYREDAAGASFLDRFLSIFDTLQRGPSNTITDLPLYFDPLAAPANGPGESAQDFLSWLAGWVGMAIKNGWPVATRRRLLANANTLYRLRGTAEGLRRHIFLFAGVEPKILELFRLRRWFALDSSTLGDTTTVAGESPMNRLQLGVHSKVGSFQLFDYGDPKLDLFNRYANQFLVVMPLWPGAGEAERRSIEEIIESAKPAHALARFEWAEPRMRVGKQALLGIDTVIAAPPNGVMEGQNKLGYDTVLGDPAQSESGATARIGPGSGIGMGSKLT